MGCSFQYFTYYIFLLVILFIKICYEVWTTWNIKLNTKNAKQLGLQNASKLQLQLISSFIISKLVSPIEATFICLDIPIIHKSWAIK
jgi:hypothetical protein